MTDDQHIISKVMQNLSGGYKLTGQATLGLGATFLGMDLPKEPRKPRQRTPSKVRDGLSKAELKRRRKQSRNARKK